MADFADAGHGQQNALPETAQLQGACGTASKRECGTGGRSTSQPKRRTSPRIVPNPYRANEPAPRISKRECDRAASSVVNNLHARARLDASISPSAQESMQSLDLGGTSGNPRRFSRNMLRGMKESGILRLLAADHSGNFEAQLRDMLSKGVRKCQRNALDLAGLDPSPFLPSPSQAQI